MKTSLHFQLKRPSTLVRFPQGITHTFSSSETFPGSGSDYTLYLAPDDGMTSWGRALGIPLCTLSKRSLQSLLVAQDALHRGDIRNSPRGPAPLFWLTDQLGNAAPSHNSPDALCSLWSHGFPLTQTSHDAPGRGSSSVFVFSSSSLFLPDWQFDSFI